MDSLENITNKFLGEVGTKENPPNSNNVRYNTEYYGRPVNGASYPWCMVFIWWVLRLYKTASCTSFVNWAKQRGKFKTTNPQVGDCVLFNFDKNPKQGVYKHIGWIYKVESGYLTTIEGNTSSSSAESQDNGGCVAMRKRKIDNHITGYITIDYGQEEKKPTQPTLRYGDKRPEVKELHAILRKLHYGVNADSDYFDFTTKQCVINYQATNLLVPDGVVGAMTWQQLNKEK